MSRSITRILCGAALTTTLVIPATTAEAAPDAATGPNSSQSPYVDVSTILGSGWYLLDVQAHYPNGPELVEGGQLLALHIPPGKFK